MHNIGYFHYIWYNDLGNFGCEKSVGEISNSYDLMILCVGYLNTCNPEDQVIIYFLDYEENVSTNCAFDVPATL